jgi:hypothetical protein
MEKDFISNINIQLNFDSTTITLYGDETIVDEFVILIKQKDNSQTLVFAPIIYYIFPELHRCGRMIVHKKNNNETKYLVHRSNFNDCPLEHPGGHIEYIELDGNNNVYSGKDYIENILQKFNMLDKRHLILAVINQNILLSINVIRWILYGTCREVCEEAGLNLLSSISNIDLIKLGSKTHYFAVSIDNNIIESGPQYKFKTEVYCSNVNNEITNISDLTSTVSSRSELISQSIPININSDSGKFITRRYDQTENMNQHKLKSLYNLSPNYYDILCDMINSENNKIIDTLTLDAFWYMRKNNDTHHAWITSTEMKLYWNQQYRSHIDNVINIIYS